MATTADYLTQLQADKQTLVDNLVAKGVEATSDETFTTLAPKVADIQSGGASFEITNASYLFYAAARIDIINELCALISNECSIFASMFQSCSKITSVPYFNTKNGTSFYNMFHSCSALITIPQFNTSNGTNFGYMFYSCSKLETIPLLDFSSGTNFNSMFQNCRVLTEIPQLDTSNAIDVGYIFYSCIALTTLGGLKDLGKAYKTTVSASYSSYKLDLSKSTLLTHDSLMNVINNLYDIASAGVQPQDLVLGETNLAKLTEEEIAIATTKGWNVS